MRQCSSCGCPPGLTGVSVCLSIYLACAAGYLRHPQYGGLLMAAFGIAIITRSETRLALAAVLWFVLHQKVCEAAALRMGIWRTQGVRCSTPCADSAVLLLFAGQDGGEVPDGSVWPGVCRLQGTCEALLPLRLLTCTQLCQNGGVDGELRGDRVLGMQRVLGAGGTILLIQHGEAAGQA